VRIRVVGLKWLSVTIAAAAVAVGCGDQRDPGVPMGGPSPATVSHGEVLKRQPYMGVSCPASNSFTCDRVGLAVWLEEPATQVEAAIAGLPLTLDDPDWSGPADHGERTMFAGFLQPAGLVDGALALTEDDGPGRWIGHEPVSAPVELTITRADGGVSTTRLEVSLSAGWG